MVPEIETGVLSNVSSYAHSPNSLMVVPAIGTTPYFGIDWRWDASSLYLFSWGTISYAYHPAWSGGFLLDFADGSPVYYAAPDNPGSSFNWNSTLVLPINAHIPLAILSNEPDVHTEYDIEDLDREVNDLTETVADVVAALQESADQDPQVIDPAGPYGSVAQTAPQDVLNRAHSWKLNSTIDCHCAPEPVQTEMDYLLAQFDQQGRTSAPLPSRTSRLRSGYRLPMCKSWSNWAWPTTSPDRPSCSGGWGDIGQSIGDRDLTPPSPRDEEGFVVVSDLVGDSIVTAIFEKQYAQRRVPGLGYVDGEPYYKLVKITQSPLTAEQDLDYRLGVLEEYRTPQRAQRFVDAWVLGPRETTKINSFDTAGTFVLHMIPGGGFSDYATQGEWGEASLSLAGDAALLVGGPLKAMAAARGAAKTAKGFQFTGVVIEGTIGTVRLGQTGLALYDGNYRDAAGYMGEAFLRLYGVKVAVKKPPVAKPKMPPAKDDPILSIYATFRQVKGTRAEIAFARRLHSEADMAVVLWGKKNGSNGADVVAVNWKTGDVYLFDTKFRSKPTTIGPSTTFTKQTNLDNALEEARQAIRSNTTLSQSVRDKALENLDKPKYFLRTVGMGNARNQIKHELLDPR